MRIGENSMKTLLTIAVVGHANTGKTSLIRTLLRNSHFGDVREEAGTTRNVLSAAIAIDQQRQIELRDTPGLEDSSALKTHLEQSQAHGQRGRELLQYCAQQVKYTPEFEQEIKVLKQSLECQLLLYVIDCREPIFAKYLDELDVLRLAAVPILPVLNFIHYPQSSVEPWRQKLAELGLHAQVAFDTVAFDFEAEKRLYQKLQTLLESHYQILQALIEKRLTDWQQLQQTACQCISHLLFDVCKIELQYTENEPRGELLTRLQVQVRQREHQALHSILKVMQFNDTDIELSQLPVTDGEWQLDLFSPQILKTFGLDTASAAATGAAIGVGVDLMFAGISLGAATATGAALGAAFHTGKRFGQKLMNRLGGQKTMYVDDTTLDVLLLRQIWLLNTVFHRGHAALQTDSLVGKPKLLIPKGWSEQRQKLRASAAGWGESEVAVIPAIGHWIEIGLQNQKND